MLSASELQQNQTRWQDEEQVYRLASSYILGECAAYKRAHPNTVRIVFSRDPDVKRLSSINEKIERCRQTNPTYSYSDVHDIIAVTTLCPYPSDVQDFVLWLKLSFNVHTPDSEASRDDLSGHRGFHYVISIHDDAIRFHPELRDVKCEIQIKTLLQEAFDAKSHDVTYKTGRQTVTPELHRQFKLLSNLLSAVDEQSEFLKQIILREEVEINLRRAGCLRMYFKQEDAESVGRRLELSITDSGTSQISIRLKYEALTKGITWELCKFAVYCALARDDGYLKAEAKRYADEFVADSRDDFRRYLLRGSILWATGSHSGALDDLRRILGGNGQDADLNKKAMNSFVYFVTDCKAVGKECHEDWEASASRYVELLSVEPDGNVLDTLGFYHIVFGKTRSDIDNGRRMLAEALTLRGKEDALYAHFYHLHEGLAVRRLIEIGNLESSAAL